MKKSKLLIGIVLMIGFFSCQSEPNTTAYSAHGISLLLPDGWKKTEQPIVDIGVQILIEKMGTDESGQFVLNILNKKIPIEAQLQNLKKGMIDNYSIQGIELNFEAIQTEVFNDMDSRFTSFEYKNSDLTFRGALRTVHCNDKTVSILTQEEQGDKAINKEGFDILNANFACTD